MVLIVLLYFSICLGQFTSLFHNLESIRFEMLQNQYANEVEIIVYNHQKDMDFQMIDGWNWIMTSYGSVNYQKKEGSIIIFFFNGLCRCFRLCLLFRQCSIWIYERLCVDWNNWKKIGWWYRCMNKLDLEQKIKF